jgi:hypothetical protein
MVPCRQTTPVQLVGHSFPSPPVTWVTPIIGPNSITQKFRIVLLKVPDDTVRADIRSQVVKLPRDPFPGPFFDARQRAEHSHPIPIGAITDGPCKSGLAHKPEAIGSASAGMTAGLARNWWVVALRGVAAIDDSLSTDRRQSGIL